MVPGKFWIMIGALFGFFGVALGAFGAHALKNTLSEYSLSIYQTGVQYQMYHALALIGFGIWVSQNSSLQSMALMDSRLPGFAFALGILLFSGSLYVLALTDIKILGAITPFGGLSFLLGWIGFAFLAWKA